LAKDYYRFSGPGALPLAMLKKAVGHKYEHVPQQLFEPNFALSHRLATVWTFHHSFHELHISLF